MRFDTKYKPVTLNPTLEQCINSGRASDYFQLAGMTAGSWGIGFIRGSPARFGMANLLAGIGFTFGTLVLVQNTRGRLMGFRENSREHTKYGAQYTEQDQTLEKPDWKHYN